MWGDHVEFVVRWTVARYEAGTRSEISRLSAEGAKHCQTPENHAIDLFIAVIDNEQLPDVRLRIKEQHEVVTDVLATDLAKDVLDKEVIYVKYLSLTWQAI
jgi:hypothetical protein